MSGCPSAYLFSARPWRLLVMALVTVMSWVKFAGAEPELMTPTEIIDIAKPAVGHAYHWGRDTWTRDGSKAKGPDGCRKENGRNVNVGEYGADCSGFVAKVWQVPKPIPVERYSHPFYTEQFSQTTANWRQLEPGEKAHRGDAYAFYRSPEETGTGTHEGHVMLLDRTESRGQLRLYEAYGCAKGIVHHVRNYVDPKYTPLRRLNLVEEVCSPGSCYGNGQCGDDHVCRCDPGYAGDHCDRCDAGFVGYPGCVWADCGASNGQLHCGSSVTVPLDGTDNRWSEYGCGEAGMEGAESYLLFEEVGYGTATISIDAPAGTRAMLLRNECDPQRNCIDSTDSVMSFEYAAHEPFILMLDSDEQRATEWVDLTVDCEVEPVTWIGDTCQSDDDCSAISRGKCYLAAPESPGFCTMPCSDKCPDLPDRATTACIADPAEDSRGICMVRSHRLNDECETVPGTVPTTTSRFRKSDRLVMCVPNDNGCLASFAGHVIDSTTGNAIDATLVEYRSESALGEIDGESDGSYLSTALPCDQYDVTISAAGYIPATISVDLDGNQTIQQLVELNAINEGCVDEPAEVHGAVVNGASDEPLFQVLVELREGVDALDGALVDSTWTDESGLYAFRDVPRGYYTIVAAQDGYEPHQGESISPCGGAAQEINPVNLMPVAEGPLSFVLNWTRPDDLDLHLLLPNGDEVSFDECAGSLEAPPFARLDVDHLTADGPESITVSRFQPGSYTLFVHNYSGQNDGAATLKESGAELLVYSMSQVVARYVVPQTGSGHFWDVLRFDGGLEPLRNMDVLNTLTNSHANPGEENSYSDICTPY